MYAGYTIDQISIVQFPETRVGALTHRGSPAAIHASIARFIEWRKENHLPPSISATFNICHDLSEGEHFMIDICAATGRDIGANPYGVVEKVIPGGRCAVLRHVGVDAGLSAAIGFLYNGWLAQSTEQRRDFPLFLQRVHFFPEVPEDQAVIDIFLPLKPLSQERP